MYTPHKRKNSARNAIKVILSQNAYPNNQLCNGKGGGHYTLFSAMLHPLRSITNKEAFLPVAMENMDNKHNSQHGDALGYCNFYFILEIVHSWSLSK